MGVAAVAVRAIPVLLRHRNQGASGTVVVLIARPSLLLSVSSVSA
jgi:hypothetical protein